MIIPTTCVVKHNNEKRITTSMGVCSFERDEFLLIILAVTENKRANTKIKNYDRTDRDRKDNYILLAY